MKQILISGDRSGSGKTSITLALSALLAKECRVQTFKAGMDYIDPSYLTAASGRPCRNLDSFAMTGSQVRSVYSHGCRDADIAIVEGVRGLYEGAEALSDTGSTAAIAKTVDLPVVLVVSAQSITRSAAALVRGFQSFDPDLRITGVILNNVKGGSHTSKATTAIEHYCGIPVIGAIPRSEDMQLAMRHLGLIPYREGSGRGDFDEKIGAVTQIIGNYVDLDHFRSLMKEGPVPAHDETIFSGLASYDIRIGIALDEAFNFYYADLFDILRSCGAECITFSPVHDRHLPDANGYIFGGGYPELFCAELEANQSMRESVLDASRRNVPIYAECGGLMYLTDRIVLRKGWQGSDQERSYAMCGVFAGETRMPARRVVSYVEGISAAESIIGPGNFRGHEFHYSDISLEPGTRFAYSLSRGIGISDRMDGATVGSTLGSYTHLHPVASAGMFRVFADGCRQVRKISR